MHESTMRASGAPGPFLAAVPRRSLAGFVAAAIAVLGGPWHPEAWRRWRQRSGGAT